MYTEITVRPMAGQNSFVLLTLLTPQKNHARAILKIRRRYAGRS
jgi:hypothetical protein